MTNRNLVFLIAVLAAVTAAGYLISWYLACGTFIGAIIILFIFYRRFSVIDEMEAEINWQRNYDRYQYEDDGTEEGAGRWDDVWRPVLFLIVLLIVLAVTAVGILL